MTQKLILFFAAFIIWCLFNWVPDREHIFVGVVVASDCSLHDGGSGYSTTSSYVVSPTVSLFYFSLCPCFLMGSTEGEY